MKETNNSAVDEADQDTSVSVSNSSIFFILLCLLSMSPATTFGYFFYLYLMNPLEIFASTSNIWIFILVILLGVFLIYVVLLFGSWFISKISVYILTGGKPITEGKYPKSINSREWRNFCSRYLVKKFSLWLFQRFAPKWLYKLYLGSFFKLGKNVKLPRYLPMEIAEIGDNCIFSDNLIVSSHLIDGNTITIKKTKIGKNCILENTDEFTCLGIPCGVILEDDVILKTKCFVPKNTILKKGGIYEGIDSIKKVGSVYDLSKEELDKYRKEMIKEREKPPKMVEEWSRFKSKAPKILRTLSFMAGSVVALFILLLDLSLLIPFGINNLGFFGHVLNLFFLPIFFFIAYGFQIFFPVIIIRQIAKRYKKYIPDVPNGPNGEIIIDDPSLITTWKKYKWITWQAINLVILSLFPETTSFIYPMLGNNKISTKTLIYNSYVDPDYVSIGDETLFSISSHVYGYSLEDGPPPQLILKRTNIGRNCVLGSCVIKAGATIGDNVILGYNAVVEEDRVLESNKTYLGNPPVELSEFLASKKKAKKD
ncbi:MAG: acyltransferase [Candidatus Hodarchaeota archaeon]